MKKLFTATSLVLIGALTMTQITLATGPSNPPPSPNLPDATFNFVTSNTGGQVFANSPTWGFTVTNNDTTGAAFFKGAIQATTVHPSGVGVYGQNSSGAGGYGTYGYAPAGIGAYGLSSSSSGVVGLSTSGTGTQGSSTNGPGVQGVSTNNYGVYGLSTNSHGVLGASTNAFAVFGNAGSAASAVAGYFSRAFSSNAVSLSTINNAIEAVGNMTIASSTKGISFTGAGNQALISKAVDVFTSGTYTNLGRYGLFYDSANLLVGIPNLASSYLGLTSYNANGTRQDYLRMNYVGDFDNPKQTNEAFATCIANGGSQDSNAICNYPISVNDYGGIRIRGTDPISWYYGDTKINSYGVDIYSTQGRALKVHAQNEIGAYTTDFQVNDNGITLSSSDIGGGGDHTVTKSIATDVQDLITTSAIDFPSYIDNLDNSSWRRGTYTNQNVNSSIFDVGARTVRIGDFSASTSGGNPAFSPKVTIDNFTAGANLISATGSATGSNAVISATLGAGSNGNGINSTVNNAGSYAVLARNNAAGPGIYSYSNGGIGTYTYSNGGNALYAYSNGGNSISANGKVLITYPNSSNIALDVYGRIKTGDANNYGGVWVDNALTQFVGQVSSTQMGFYNSGWRLWVDNAGGLYVPSSTAQKGGGGSWGVYSDARLKDIKGTFDRGLADILKANPIKYMYKKDNPKHLDTDKTFIGFVAQEIQKAIPEAVTEGSDGYLVVNNDPIIWTMLNAIKELAGKDEALKQENVALKAKVENLEQRLEALEAKLN